MRLRVCMQLQHERPVVVAGGIVRNRAWILGESIWRIRSQGDAAYPWHIYYITGDNEDDTELILKTHGHDDYQPSVSYDVINTGYPGYERSGEVRYHSSNMGPLRNAWARLCLEQWPNITHLWIVDSDVLPASDTLARLLSHDEKAVGAWVPGCTPMEGWSETEGKPRRTGLEKKHDTLFKATCLGGSYLLRRDFIDEMMPDIWGEDPQGEDGYLAKKAMRLGISMYADPKAQCEHVMEKPHDSLS